MRRALVLGFAAFTALGCSARPTFFASPDDYAAYRKTRISPTLEGRLAAADRYLAQFPDGPFLPVVKPWFLRAELVFFKSKQGSLAGLEDYLKTLPRGPHADEAEGRRNALLTTRANREAELGSAESLNSKLDQASAERRAVRDALLVWMVRFLDPGVWKKPLSEAKSDLVVPFSLELPSPTCAPLEAPLPSALPEGAVRRCAKVLELPYSVTVDGERDARQATVEIAIVQDASGRPLRATIGGPELFLRLEETFTVRAISPSDPAKRGASRERALEFAANLFEQRIGREPVCDFTPAPPLVLDRACHGVRMTVRPAWEPGDDDLFILEPEIPVTPISKAP